LHQSRVIGTGSSFKFGPSSANGLNGLLKRLSQMAVSRAFGYLLDRWRIGEKVDQVNPNRR